MTKPDIVTYVLEAQEEPVNGDGRKDTELTAFKGNFKELKGNFLNMHGALTINELSAMTHALEEIIGRAYKNGSDAKRCLETMKEINFQIPKPDMGDGLHA